MVIRGIIAFDQETFEDRVSLAVYDKVKFPPRSCQMELDASGIAQFCCDWVYIGLAPGWKMSLLIFLKNVWNTKQDYLSYFFKIWISNCNLETFSSQWIAYD